MMDNTMPEHQSQDLTGPELKIKRIRLRNWMTVKAADLAFPDQGLILVIGSNLAAEGKLQSVGAGKSCLGEALSRAITGVPGRYANLGHYSSDTGSGNTLVAVEATCQGKPLLIEMGYKCPELSRTGEGLRFTYDGKAFMRGHPDQTREELNRTVRATPALAEWTVFLDGDRLKFNRMSQQDSVNLLMTALAQPPWTDYFEKATQMLQDGRRQVTTAEQALVMAKMRQDRLNLDLEEAKEDHARAIRDYQRQTDELAGQILELKKASTNDRHAITAAEEAVAKLQKQIKLLTEQNAIAAHGLDIQRQHLRDKLAIQEKDWLKTTEDKSARAADLAQARKRLEALQRVPKNCPTCGKPWDKALSQEELTRADVAVTDASHVYSAALQTHAEANAKRASIQEEIRVIERQMREESHLADIQELNAKVTAHDRLVRSLTAGIQQRELKIANLERGVDTTFVNKKSAIVEERQRALTETLTGVRTAAEDLALEEQAFRVLEYWHKAYGPTGIPNLVLADAIAPLNRVAQRISALMTGGTLQVSYSTRRELASGDSKAQLVIKVENKIGSRRLEGSSKGEAGLTNLIIAENLSEIGQVSRRIGFRFYDEITSGQDAVVRRSIFSYLKDTAHRLGILIFVVDHHAEAANFADYILVAEKTRSSGTRFEWR